jgi:uncharacterized membrane protein
LGIGLDHGVMMSLSGAVLVAATLATGWEVGVFGLYAHTIMPGLRQVDDYTFVAAFQSIDRAIINPWFLTAFLGAPLLCAAGVVVVWGDGGALRIGLVAALALLVVGMVITFAVNVPLNDALKAAGDPGKIADLAAVRRAFDASRWSAWNLVRTLTTAAAFAILVVSVGAHG